MAGAISTFPWRINGTGVRSDPQPCGNWNAVVSWLWPTVSIVSRTPACTWEEVRLRVVSGDKASRKTLNMERLRRGPDYGFLREALASQASAQSPKASTGR